MLTATDHGDGLLPCCINRADLPGRQPCQKHAFLTLIPQHICDGEEAQAWVSPLELWVQLESVLRSPFQPLLEH